MTRRTLCQRVRGRLFPMWRLLTDLPQIAPAKLHGALIIHSRTHGSYVFKFGRRGVRGFRADLSQCKEYTNCIGGFNCT